MGRHEVNGAQQRERKALSQEFCVNVTMGEAKVWVSPKELSAAFGTRRPKKEWFIHLWLMVLPGFNLPVRLLTQGQDSNKAPLVHVPHHCAAPRAFHCTRNQSCCSLLYSDNCSRYRRGNRTCGKPLKNQTRKLSFSKTGASPSFPVAPHPSIGSVALSPLPRLLNGRIAGMQIVLVMQLLMVRFTAEASHHFKPHNGSLGDGTLQN